MLRLHPRISAAVLRKLARHIVQTVWTNRVGPTMLEQQEISKAGTFSSGRPRAESLSAYNISVGVSIPSRSSRMSLRREAPPHFTLRNDEHKLQGMRLCIAM